MKEYYVPYTLAHNITANVLRLTELRFVFSYVSLNEIKFENYCMSNNRTSTTNYKSIHFIIGGKELTEEQISTLKDPNDEIFNLHNGNRGLATTLCQSCFK
jgi:hypothetical protein